MRVNVRISLTYHLPVVIFRASKYCGGEFILNDIIL